MKDRPLLAFGTGGTPILALDCFTPTLVGLLSVMGLAEIMEKLDVVLLPALVILSD